jgi:hypothetical protein
LRLAEGRLTFAAGFFFIELHPRDRPTWIEMEQACEKPISMRARYIRENTVRVNPGIPKLFAKGSAEQTAYARLGLPHAAR